MLRWPLLAGLVAVLVAGSWLTARLVSADSASRLRGRKGCPVGAKPLPSNALAPAVTAALSETPTLYRGLDTHGARAIRAYRAEARGDRSAQVRHYCGAETQRRTVVIDLEFPEMAPSASLEQGSVFVSRFRNRYRVWQVAH